ncbi:conserved hypothetical protein [Dyadobacter fermentans DSM 18053]|uniref:Uncharacterized protein n=2 Tax=Dyadobacter fermentans TaxID=94254 RepID=C6W3W6_DYAFD|nr:conserved hypothetical protein [Dyadobacter fermentans DSM 18053]
MDTMRTLRILGLFILMFVGVSVSNKTEAQPGFRVTFETFYDELAPYGRWVRNPQFGSVWIPDVPRGFQPYSTAGYWEQTEYGNTWVSEYDWGWAPFHYGRWNYDDYYGWFWVPDYEWGPAWVNWRSGGGYYGWAPLGPGVNINVSINIPSFWWVFVPQRYITSPRWHSYCAPARRVSHYYNNTVVINNYYRSDNRTYVFGPRRDEIERVTRRSVPVRTIDASPRGRGRVIIADRGNGNYDYGNRGGRSNGYPRTDRSNRNDDNRIEPGDNSRRGSRNPYDERSSRNDRNRDAAPYGRGNDRIERNRESSPFDNRSEAPNPGRSDRNEAPNRSQRNREYNPGNSPERNREYNPGNAPERANRSEQRIERPNIERPERQERSNRSYEPAPRAERQERNAPEPRSNDRGNRGGDNGGGNRGGDNGNRGGGGGERSGRGPR